jgi:hypothetical protein
VDGAYRKQTEKKNCTHGYYPRMMVRER